MTTTAAPVVDAGAGVGTGGAALRVVVVNGSPNDPSKTTGLVEVILETLAGMLPVESSRIDVYRLGPGFTGAIEREDLTPEVEAAFPSKTPEAQISRHFTHPASASHKAGPV